MEKRTYSTDREIKALKPFDRWYDVKDEKTRNLMVRVGPRNGSGRFRRTFVMVTRFPGSKNPTRHAFGEYGDLTLEEARARTDEWRALIRNNIDPRDALRQEKEAVSRKRDLTFGSVVEEYLKRHVTGQRRAVQVEREIRNELVPVWKDKQITEISRSDVVTLIEEIADRPAPYQAHNIFGHIRTFFNWAIDRGKYDLETSPCDRLKPARLIGEKKPRQRVLSDAEICAFLKGTERLGYPYGPLMSLLMVTGQRKSEVADARWREFHPELVKMLCERKPNTKPIQWSKLSDDLKVWTVPPERFKSGSSHLVPLVGEALKILETLPLFYGSAADDYLFSTAAGSKAVNGFSKAKQRLDAEMLSILREISDDAELPAFVLHDVRRTVRTRLSALRISERVAEMVIGHGKKGLARVYDQHEFYDEMREALELWERKLTYLADQPIRFEPTTCPKPAMA